MSGSNEGRLAASRGRWSLWLGALALAGCVPIEARGGLGAIESERGVDGAVCGVDGAAASDSSLPSVDASPDSLGAPAPISGFRLEATPLRADVERGSRVTFEVRVVRARGFTAPIVIQAFGLPTGCAAEPVAAADLPAALVVMAEGLAPASSAVPFAIHGSAAGHRATLRAEIAVTGPPIVEE